MRLLGAVAGVRLDPGGNNGKGGRGYDNKCPGNVVCF